MGFIYKITNTTNGKSYIGQTIQKPKKRFNSHFSQSNCPAIHNAIQKYGRDAFTVEILHEVLDIFLDDLEISEIKRHNTLAPNGYNLDGGGNANKVMSDQTRKKISEANKGRKHTPETRQKMSNKKLSPEHRKKISNAKKGKTLSPAARQKLSVANKGRTFSPETRQKISESKKGKTLSPEHRQKLSESHKGKTLSPETRKKLSDANKGRTFSLETRKKISAANKGRKRSPETCQKLSDVNRGKTHTSETRKKISEAGKRREPPSPETRQKISDANKGRTFSPEHRKKISEAGKGRTLSPEARKKLSDANKGKTLSPEHRQKLSLSRAHPDRASAYEILNTLPEDMSLKEKRKLLRDTFPERSKSTVQVWVKKWYETSSSYAPPAPSDRHIAFEILNALPQDISLTERRRILRDTFPDRDRRTIYRWVKQWSETSL